MFSFALKIVALSAYVAVAVSKSVPSYAPVYTDLAAKLSKTALIYSPGTDSFAAAVARWSNSSIPVSNLVVVPGTEADVIEIVSFLESVAGFVLTRGSFRSNLQTRNRCRFLQRTVSMDPLPV